MYKNFGGSRATQVLLELILQFSALQRRKEKRNKKGETAFWRIGVAASSCSNQASVVVMHYRKLIERLVEKKNKG
jgi:hypothetical protein